MSTSISIKEQVEKQFEPCIGELKEKANNPNRQTEKGFVNEKTGSSILIRDDGTVSMAGGKYASYKLTPGGIAREVSLKSETVTNRKSLTVDEIVINNHKLNPALYEMADMVQVLDDDSTAVGALTVMGTVLVKAWEPNLKKYVLMRRQVRLPLFSPTINTVDIPAGLGISDPGYASAQINATAANDVSLTTTGATK